VDFPAALRERRTRLRVSQLDLALRAGTTQRHVSFMESGRSAPGRAMVVRLAESLELPLRDRNALLLAAGFAPAYPETGLDEPGLAPVRHALTTVLDGHRPYPAIVVDRHGDLVAANGPFGLLTEGVAAELLAPPANAYRVALHPDGLAPRIVNLAEWARHVLERLDQALERGPDDRLAALRAELGSYVPPAAVGPDHLGFAVPLRLRSGGGELRLITTVTTFATAVDVTLAELKLEAFLPADAATAEALATAAG
jgi:transcriptional regulator with XRE-family HTH domain